MRKFLLHVNDQQVRDQSEN